MKQIINTHNAPKPVGAYSQAVLVGNALYVSGQIPINPLTGDLVVDSVESQTHQVMKNIEAILCEANMSFSNVVNVSIFVTDMSFFERINKVYEGYFSDKVFPARQTVQVCALPKGADVEISCIAVK